MSHSIAEFPLAHGLEGCRGLLSRPQFRHLEYMLAGQGLNGKGEKNIMDLAEAVNRLRLDQHLPRQERRRVDINDTLIEKAGHQMECTGHLCCHCIEKNRWCHCHITAFHSNVEERVPLHLFTYVKEDVCERPGRREKVYASRCWRRRERGVSLR